MTDRRLKALVILLAALVFTTAVLVILTASRKLTYQGKAAKEWFDRITINTADKPSDPDVQGLMAIGDSVVPFLVDQLRLPSPLESLIERVRQRLNIHQTMHDSVIDRVMKAYYLLSNMGPKAKAAVPDLLRIAEDTSYPLRSEVIGLLGDIRSEPDRVVPFLTQCLTREDIRLSAALSLGQFGRTAEQTAPLLRNMIENGTPGETDYLVAALIGMSNSLDVALPLAKEKLDSTNVVRRYAFVHWLSILSPDAKAAVPFLRRALTDEDATVRKYATNGLKRIDPEAATREGIP
jgi:hypothetical protein